MATILEARVMNKVATLAEWSAENPVILPGEICLIRDESGVVNQFRVNPEGSPDAAGTPFNELVDSFNFQNLIAEGIAEPSTDPGTPQQGDSYFAGAGTFTNFLDSGSQPITTTENLNVLTYNGTFWDVLPVPISVDLSGYVEKSGIKDNLVSIDTDEPLSANQGRVLNDKIGSIATIGYSYVDVGNTDGPSIAWRNETSTFSGWGCLVPPQPAFNAIKIKLRSWDVANPINNVRVIIREGSSAGNILADETVPFSGAVGVETDVEVVFNSDVDSASSLWVIYLTDGHSGIYGPLTGFTETKWTTAQDLVTEPTGGSGLEYGAYFVFQQATESAEPTQEFSDKVIENSPQLASTIDKVDSAITTELGSTDPVESFPVSTAAYRVAAGINGWGSPIGPPQQFNTVSFKIRASSGNATDITAVRCWITSVDGDGAVLADKTITGLAISALETADLQVVFDSTIENQAADELFFVFACDQDVDQFGTDSANFYASPPYGHSRYTTNTNIASLSPSAFGGAGGGQRNVWVETNFQGQVPAPTDIFAQEIAKKLPGSSLDGLIEAEIVLPSRIYSVEGTELNIYWDNIVHSNYPLDGLDIDITCSKGQQFAKYWRYTPTASDTGNTTFSISVKHGDQVIASATATLYTVALTSGNGVSRSVIAVGDSTTDGGEYLEPTAVDHVGDAMSITFKGTQGTDPVKNEGRGGYTVHDYATEGRTLYRFDVSGVTVAPGVGSTYSDGAGSTYQIREINIAGGTGYVAGQLMSGPGTPAASGTITKVSGTGDASITYSATSFTSGNPFWNGSALDFAGYLANNSISMSSGDWVTFHLGINDVFNETSDSGVDAKATTMITELRALIANMKAAVPGLRIGLCLTIPPSGSQDAFGVNYGNGQTMVRYERNNKIWVQKMIEEFDTDAERTAGNYLVPFNTSIDRFYNFPKQEQNANARSTDQVTVWENGVHPAQGGYYQMGDVLFAFLKNLI